MLLNFQTYYLRLYRHATKENFEMNDGKLRMILILILTLSYNAGQFFSKSCASYEENIPKFVKSWQHCLWDKFCKWTHNAGKAGSVDFSFWSFSYLIWTVKGVKLSFVITELGWEKCLKDLLDLFRYDKVFSSRSLFFSENICKRIVF